MTRLFGFNIINYQVLVVQRKPSEILLHQMNYYPFFNISAPFMAETHYYSMEMQKKFQQFHALLTQQKQEIAILKHQNQNLKQTVTDLQQKLSSEEKKPKPTRKITKNYYRRNAYSGSDPNSRIICPYNDCHHHYSSILALNFHIKYKHNGGNKKQRQAYAKIIIQAQLRGEELPKINFNFPPGFFDKYRESYLKQRELTNLEKKHLKRSGEQKNLNMKAEQR